MAGGLLRELADPRAKAVRLRALAEISLVLGLSTLLLFPTLGPVTLLLGIPAWITGHLDSKFARRGGHAPDPSAELGRALGKGVCMLLAAVVGLAVMVWALDEVVSF